MTNAKQKFQKDNRHVPVLLDEVLQGLRLESGMTVVDATVGNAGHALAIANQIGPSGLLIGLDADPLAIQESTKFLQETETPFKLFNTNFSNLSKTLLDQGIDQVDAVLMDLGLRRGSLEDSGRGFSFQKLTEPLDMRFDPNDDQLITAEEILNTWSEETLADIFYGFGGERLSRRYARSIVSHRSHHEFKTVADLVEVIEGNTPAKACRPGRSSATKVFQALRMAVNRELSVLPEAISQAIKVIKSGGRLAIITFHSGEDRLVKQTFKSLQTDNKLTIDPKRAIKPNQEEIIKNPLSRSATLRLATIN